MMSNLFYWTGTIIWVCIGLIFTGALFLLAIKIGIYIYKRTAFIRENIGYYFGATIKSEILIMAYKQPITNKLKRLCLKYRLRNIKNGNIRRNTR